MMKREVGVRSLKARAAEVVREIREEGATYTITYRGKPVALIVPIDRAENAASLESDHAADEGWDELHRLGDEIARQWTSQLTAVEAISEMRR